MSVILAGTVALVSHALSELMKNKDFERSIASLINKARTFEESSEQKRKKSFSALKNHFRDNRLVLVTGSGISTEHSLPLWNELLNKLLLSSFLKDSNQSIDAEMYSQLSSIYANLFAPSPIVTAKYLSNRMSESDFLKSVHKVIYESERFNKKSSLYSNIAKLATGLNLKSRLQSIITYNFDDTLERFLKIWDKRFILLSLHPGSPIGRPDCFSIIHPHGYLPRNTRKPEQFQIVLAGPQYHEQYTQSYSWSNIIQLMHFVQNNCMFVGLSGIDPNLRRLLDVAAKIRGTNENHHYIVLKRKTAGDVTQSITSYLRGRETLIDKNKINELSQVLLPVMQRFEEEDYESFGLGVVWIDDYNQIPDTLEKLHQ
jgi:hypothetical protein